MHATSHDTCGHFCWVTDRSPRTSEIGQLGTITNLPDEVRQACARALNSYALADYYIREARQRCANAINSAKRDAWKQSLKTAEVHA